MSDRFTLHFTTPLGHAISVACSEEEIDATIRRYGRRGWCAIPDQPGGIIRRGGLRLPYDNEADFDWSLLGGYLFPDQETGETLLWCRGYVWKRRDLPANTKKSLPPAIKWSRGALPTDPEEIVEDDGSGFKYVTLVVFKGGRRREMYARQSD